MASADVHDDVHGDGPDDVPHDVRHDVPHESRRQHARRMGSRAKLYVSVIVLVGLVLVIVLLALDNRNDAQLSWVVGDTTAPVIWIVLFSAIVGWVAGIVTHMIIRRRTRAPH